MARGGGDTDRWQLSLAGGCDIAPQRQRAEGSWKSLALGW